MAYKLYIVFCYIAAASGQFVDEMQTFTMECLEENVFECLDGGCILQDRYCDGNYDCKDGSDENFCSNHTANAVYCNETHQYECADGKSCVPNSWVCNFEPDCEDGSDERNCTVTVIAPNATCKGFTCDGNRCISTFWMCDGAYDCEDKTDEDIENTCRHALRPREMNSGVNCKIEIPGLYELKEYACLDRSFCVPRDHMCDGIKDCKDGSDEGTFCQHWHTMCDNFPCNGTKCAPDRSGPYCDCQSAHKKYNYTTQHCESVNNCMDDVPWCSHQCVRAADTFKCVCEPGYDMDFAGYLCYAPDPEAMLFYSTRNEIRYINVKSKTESVVASGIKQAHGVTYDGNFVYWVETAQGHQAIVRAHLNNVLETKEVLVALGLEDPGDIAIDYLGGNIYFTDVERGVISVCKTDGSVCSVLHADTRRPRYVTVDPRNGKMFWADWMDRPLIMTSVMDGTHPEILVDVLGGYATGLALDAANDRLYFVDGTIRVVKLFDKNVYSLFEEPYHHPYTISIFENTVYWSEWTTKTIQTSDKMHSDKRALLVSRDEPVFDMHIYHPLLTQHEHNPCAHNGCSHICIPTSNSTYACVCPEGMALEGRVCAAIPEYRPQYLIVASGSLFTRIQYNMLGNPETHTTHFDIARVQAMAYDNFRDTLFLYDGQRKSINYINMSDFTLGVTRLFEYNALENVIDMGYDYVSDALYILDAGRRMIDVISLRTKQRTLIHRFSGQEIPVSFCIVPEYGRLLVALVESESNNEIYIDSMGLDGQDKMHILTNNILGPNIRLRYSPEMDIVYIADEGHGIIDYFHPEGTGRTHFREITTTIANLAVTDTHVFWTDRHTQRVYWADVHKHGHVVRRMDLSIFPNTTFLHLQVTSPPPDIKNPLTKHACFQTPSPCSHICVQIPHPIPQDLDMGYKCMCPIGLVWDGEGCVGLVECKLHESYCYKSNECYLMGKKCDGIRDCRYGEDEESCPPHITQSSQCGYGQKMCNNICIGKNDICKDNVATVTCSPMEVQCVNTSICIAKSSVCNGLSDCPEGTDETPAACSTIQCLDTEFTCTSSPCIPISWKCDGFDDCADGSDEINCKPKKCEEGYFQCGDLSCIPLSKRCDGHSDCFDEMDEDNCQLPEIIETRTVICHLWEFRCEHNSSICLPLTARCNKKVDCPGGTDEAGCDFHCAPNGLYPCAQELKCVTKNQLCNGRKDCTDGSDETIEACIKANKTLVYDKIDVIPQTCNHGYTCNDGTCVEWRQVCDHVTNCRDGTDEKGLCSTPCNTSCPNFCHRTPRGPQCVCPLGYKPRGDTCDDVDECVNDVCSHVCHNIPGSFVCSCYGGYALGSDHRSCKAIRGDATVLYTKGADIWSVFAHHHYLEYSYSRRIDDLDYDFRKNKLYITVSSTEELIEVNRNQKSYTITAISNIGKPTKVSVDWITGNVYFVDSKIAASHVRVCNYAKKVCARLQKLPSNAEVSSLVVDPTNRRMFYCIVESHESYVRSASLTGRDISDIGTVANCSGLAVDGFKRMLYVMDSHTGLWRISYDGNNRVLVIKNNAHIQNPHSPVLFEDHIYFLDNNKLKRCLLYAAKTCENYFHLNASNFILHQESVQRDIDVKNSCVNYKCSNVCVMEAKPMCVCADGALAANGKCPLLKQNELLMINGQIQQDPIRHSVTFTLTIIVLVLFAIYMCVFVHYHFVTKCKNRNGTYMQVRYHNRPDAMTDFTNAFAEVPTAGGIGHQFVNPLLYVRTMWQDKFNKNKPIGTAGLTFDTQQDLSDTESDLDLRDTKQMLRNR